MARSVLRLRDQLVTTRLRQVELQGHSSMNSSVHDKVGAFFATGLLVATAALACGSDEPAASTATPEPTVTASPVATATATATPTPTPTATSTSVPATATPVPTATAMSDWLVNDIVLGQAQCVSFHPGVPNPDGPNHWYEISGNWTNDGDSALTVLATFQILGDHPGVLRVLEMDPRTVGPGETAAFFQSHPMQPVAGASSCRALFTVEGDVSGARKSESVELEEIFAP